MSPCGAEISRTEATRGVLNVCMRSLELRIYQEQGFSGPEGPGDG